MPIVGAEYQVARVYHVQSYRKKPHQQSSWSSMVGREEQTLEFFDFVRQDQLAASNFLISWASKNSRLFFWLNRWFRWDYFFFHSFLGIPICAFNILCRQVEEAIVRSLLLAVVMAYLPKFCIIYIRIGYMCDIFFGRQSISYHKKY